MDTQQAILTRDDILQILREHEGELREMAVRSLAIFGSAARDEAGPESDIDMLIEF